MPFPQQNMRPFTESDIASISPGQSGCYGIFNPSGCIYIGQAQDIQARLFQHVRRQSDQSICIWRYSPSYWLGVVNVRDLNTMEQALISEFRPACNPI